MRKISLPSSADSIVNAIAQAADGYCTGDYTADNRAGAGAACRSFKLVLGEFT
ncbi:MAG: hypothetical protein IKN55_03780 [Oscillospiraceae bacterium]|nr:hypothetical protein [Oscillospiraceae bacterium]